MTRKSDSPSLTGLLSSWLCTGLLATARLAGAARSAPRRLGAESERDLFEVARTVPATQISPYTPGRRDTCIVELKMPRDEIYAGPSSRNHAEYAALHKYSHIGFRGRISQELFTNPERGPLTHKYAGGLYWQAFVGLAWAMDEKRESGESLCEWVMWMDNDAIVTNFEVRVEEIIRGLRTEREMAEFDVILAREDTDYAGNFFNSGIYFVRNSVRGRTFLREVTALWDKYKHLHDAGEQVAMAEVAFGRDPGSLPMTLRAELESGMPSHIAAAPQRLFNSFLWRGDVTHDSHTTVLSEWEPGDFILHIASRNGADRRAFIVARDAAAIRP